MHNLNWYHHFKEAKFPPLLFFYCQNKASTHQLIHPSAVLPDLSSWCSEGTNVSHLDHGSNKIRTEGAWVVAVTPNNGIRGAAIEQLLIRVEESSPVYEVLEVVVFKRCWSLDIKGCQIVVPWASCSWTVSLPCLSKGTVNVALIVYARSEWCAPCLSNCVWPWIYNSIWDKKKFNVTIGESPIKYKL